METKEIPVRVSLPLGMHPSMCQAKGPEADSARHAMAGLYSAAGKMQDMEKTSVDRDALGRAAKPYATKAVAQAGACVERLQEQLTNVKAEIAREIISKPYASQTIGAEVRAHYKAENHRLARLNSVIIAAGNGDEQAHRIMSEVLQAPPFLSGLSDKDHLMLRGVTASRVCPAMIDRRNNIEASLRTLSDATDDFSKLATKQINSWVSRDTDLLAETFKI